MKLKAIFAQLFTAEPLVVRAPGRINLIGEHTDYNLGFSMPAAIDRYIYVAVSARGDREMHLHSAGFAPVVLVLNGLTPAPGEWHTYVQGVVSKLMDRGYALSGFNLYVTGDIPTGAGLSSSAALSCGVVMALAGLFDLQLPLIEMAKIAQGAEHDFAGVKCGLMDQMACLLSTQGMALKVDFQSMHYELVPANLGDYELFLIDSGVKHELASSEYNNRRMDCEKALAMVKAVFPKVTSFRDVNIEQLYQAVLIQDPVAYARAKFVLEENDRVEKAARFMRARDYDALGDLMCSSHKGLSRLYQVSCEELDFLQAEAIKHSLVAGSRMMGGGFGGCTINLVRKDRGSAQVLEAICLAFEAAFGRRPVFHSVRLSSGARILEDSEVNQIDLKV